MTVALLALLLACEPPDAECPPGRDADGDGYDGSVDCDDTDDRIGPRERVYRDYDGDGFGGVEAWLCMQHYDGDDSVVLIGGDCDDTDRFTYPGALESCDQIDNDCDGRADDYDASDIDPDDGSVFWLDIDGDGYGRPYTEIVRCEQPHGYAMNDGDCDDDDWRVHPGAPGRFDCE